MTAIAASTTVDAPKPERIVHHESFDLGSRLGLSLTPWFGVEKRRLCWFIVVPLIPWPWEKIWAPNFQQLLRSRDCRLVFFQSHAGIELQFKPLGVAHCLVGNFNQIAEMLQSALWIGAPKRLEKKGCAARKVKCFSHELRLLDSHFSDAHMKARSVRVVLIEPEAFIQPYEQFSMQATTSRFRRLGNFRLEFIRHAKGIAWCLVSVCGHLKIVDIK